MTPRWEPSSEKHGLPRGDIIYAILHATYAAEIEESSLSGGRITVYIGPPRSQTEREIEVLVLEFPTSNREASIFHAMPRGPRFRTYREDHPHG